MKFMEFQYKDIFVKVHTPFIVTRLVEENNVNREELVFANVIDIDSRVQAVFAQFHHAKKTNDVRFWISHAPRIGETDFDKSSFIVRPAGNYKHLSQREDDTFVTGIVVSEKALDRKDDGFIIFAWDGNILEKLFWAINRYYETPLLEEWTPYLLDQLIKDKHMVSLTLHDFADVFPHVVVYELLVGEDVLDQYISDGLKTGVISLIEDEEIQVKECI